MLTIMMTTMIRQRRFVTPSLLSESTGISFMYGLTIEKAPTHGDDNGFFYQCGKWILGRY
jgi:hypothetical protein